MAASLAGIRARLERPRENGLARVVRETEMVILSTCGRTELYFAGGTERQPGASVDQNIALLLGRSAFTAETVAPRLYRRSGADALRHVCRVASGLDSMVLGEAEVLGQTSEARDAARVSGTLGPILDAVFTCAIRAGRRARTETSICRGSVSVSSEAIALVADGLGGLVDRQVLLVGTGHMAKRAAEGLQRQAGARVSVIGRTAAHLRQFSNVLGATARPWSELGRAIGESDAVICATAAPEPVLSRALLRPALAARTGARPLVLVDIGMPRNVAADVRDLPGARLFDLDDLQRRLQGNRELRQHESPLVEAIIAEEIAGIEAAERNADLRPKLRAMREWAEQIRRQELAQLIDRLPDLSPHRRSEIERMSHAVVNKLLHEPTMRLRSLGEPDLPAVHAEVARQLSRLGQVPTGSGRDAVNPAER
jgi:glutamyl-tRNA reductase